MEAQWLGAIKSQLIGAIPADVKLVGALKGVTPCGGSSLSIPSVHCPATL
jgi:hypothetical protein